MNLALLATAGLWTPLQQFLRRLGAGAPAPAVVSVSRPHRSGCGPTSRVVAPAIRRPLRVVRVMEAGQPRSQVGRMVISGRMADVCAELDRLAACEAARH